MITSGKLLTRLQSAIALEISILGPRAETRAGNLFHTPREILTMAIESIDTHDWHACIHLVEKLQIELMGTAGFLEARMRLIELTWRIERESRLDSPA